MSSPASTSLTLRAILKAACLHAGLDLSGGVVTGLSPAAKALAVAASAAEAPAIVVVPTDADVEQMTADSRFFLAAIEGRAEASLARTVLPFPSHEIDPYRGLAPHFDITSARSRALHAMASGAARVVVASSTALLPRLSAPRRLSRASLDLLIGGTLSPTDLGDLLADAGFTREDPVDEHGEFCVRGGVVDFFPTGETHPVRVEFVGDTIESIRRYEPSTQRSVAILDRTSVVPLREVFETGRTMPSATASEDTTATDVLLDPLTLAPSRSSLRARGAPPPHAAPSRSVSAFARGPTDGRAAGADSLVALRQAQGDAAPRRRGPPATGGAGEGGRSLGEGEPSGLDRSASFFDFVGLVPRARLIVSERAESLARLEAFRGQIDESYREAQGRAELVEPPECLVADLESSLAALGAATRLEMLDLDEAAAARVRHVACQQAIEFRGRLADWIDEIRRARARGDAVLFVAATAGRAERVAELLAEHELAAVSIDRADDTHGAAVLVATGQLSRGFRLPDGALQLYSEPDVFDEERRVRQRRRSQARSFLADFRDLKVGDHVVHGEHGIGVFVGLKRIPVSGEPHEFMELQYAGGDKLFVPVEHLDLIEKYTGAARPTLDRLGGTTWARAKTRVRRAMRDMAEELIKLYAARKAMPGHAFSSDTHWQREFEDAFEYELTPDQQTAIAEIKRDMEQPAPMDRLLCGDVGYGKTEVAMRAAFKAVMDGKQVALLAPTTVLAFQHVKTFTDRFAGFPVRIEMISRFRTQADQTQAIADLAAGKVDIIIGTHRLLSKDVRFQDFGLLIVDEEQRFGVAHKERIKQLRRKVDVLTMTATPIPRTLNMSLAGIRDMSLIETPPKDRLAIQTHVARFEAPLIAQAIRNELARQGQVYFVHNRVESIYSIANLITKLVPEARVAVAHGQTREDALERAMVDFVQHKCDVLAATTIIENGLDIPNVNTIIVNHADKYGLAQLYQLRGRVGRSDRRAYAYLLVPPEDVLSPVAKQRLAAIREFSDLGSGFRVAALDLEIRGAGNLLGGEQSGHIEAVGFDTYVKLLEQTVRELKGEELEDEIRARVNLSVDLRIDETYIADMNQRLAVYRKVAAARNAPALTGILEEVADRYGPIPTSVINLAAYGRIRIMADQLGVEAIEREGRVLVVRFRSDARLDPMQLIAYVQKRADVTLTPPGVLRIELDHARTSAGRAGRAARLGGSTAVSWWTRRATAGRVTPGFSKEEMLRAERRASEGDEGVLGRVAAVLDELSHHE